MTIDFICEELAELFDSPCNYSPIDEKMFQDSYCEGHCGKVTDKECWKQYFEKVWADRKTEPNSSEKPNNSTISKMEQVDESQTEDLFTDRFGDVWEWRGDAWYCISGDEPQTDCAWK